MGLTAAQQAKSVGLKSLSQVSKITGVSRQTLENWHQNKPQLFAVVLAGSIAMVAEDYRKQENS